MKLHQKKPMSNFYPIRKYQSLKKFHIIEILTHFFATKYSTSFSSVIEGSFSLNACKNNF